MEKQLPKNWVETIAENVFDFVYGKSIPVSDFADKGFDVYGANGVIGKYPTYTYELPKVIISCRGAASGVIHKTKEKSIVTSNSIVFNEILKNSINIDFTKYMLSYVDKKDIITGTAQPQITIQLLNKLDIFLPPLAEQERIAEKLDALFGQLDSVRGAMSRIPTLLANLRQQILTYAITGKLTHEWRQGKEQYDLYDVISNIKSVRIKSNAKSQANKEKIESIYSDDSSSIDFFIPDEWISVNLDKVCMAFSYGTSAKSEEYGKYPVLRMGNIQKGKITWDDLKYTSDDNEFNKYKVNKGDILFNRTNSPELVGKTAIFDTDYDACYAGYIIKITPCIEVNSSYLNIVLNSQYARRWCWENKSDGVSQSNINAQKISKFTIPYPHLPEQKEIVNRVQSLFEKLDSIEQRYQMLKTKLENLPQAILHKAFKGELVEQLPSDGNATDLLREIEQLKKSLKKK